MRCENEALGLRSRIRTFTVPTTATEQFLGIARKLLGWVDKVCSHMSARPIPIIYMGMISRVGMRTDHDGASVIVRGLRGGRNLGMETESGVLVREVMQRELMRFEHTYRTLPPTWCDSLEHATFIDQVGLSASLQELFEMRLSAWVWTKSGRQIQKVKKSYGHDHAPIATHVFACVFKVTMLRPRDFMKKGVSDEVYPRGLQRIRIFEVP